MELKFPFLIFMQFSGFVLADYLFIYLFTENNKLVNGTVERISTLVSTGVALMHLC
jgi:hypothetical protein